MKENYLKDFETFLENPDGVLKIDDKSNLFYIQYDGENYVGRQLLRSCEVIKNDLSEIKTEIVFFDIFTGNEITNINLYTSINFEFKYYMEKNLIIIPLVNLLPSSKKNILLNMNDFEKMLKIDDIFTRQKSYKKIKK